MHPTIALDELTEAELLDHADEVSRVQRECEAQVLRIAVQHASQRTPGSARPKHTSAGRSSSWSPERSASPELAVSVSSRGLCGLGLVTSLGESARRESTTTTPPRAGSRRSVPAASFDARPPWPPTSRPTTTYRGRKGHLARFHGSSESGRIVSTCSPGLFKDQPPAKPASRMGERSGGCLRGRREPPRLPDHRTFSHLHPLHLRSEGSRHSQRAMGTSTRSGGRGWRGH